MTAIIGFIPVILERRKGILPLHARTFCGDLLNISQYCFVRIVHLFYVLYYNIDEVSNCVLCIFVSESYGKVRV